MMTNDAFILPTQIHSSCQQCSCSIGVAKQPMDPAAAARVIVRLTDPEREVLKILTAALKVSEYTDDVDCVRSYQRAAKMKEAMIEVFTALSGLAHIAKSLRPDTMKKLAKDCLVSDLQPFLANAFEVGRRFKRMNPDKLRTEYGKLVMLLQDLAAPGMERDLGLDDMVLPVKTVQDVCDLHNLDNLLHHPKLTVATAPADVGTTSAGADAKEQARSDIVAEHGGPDSEKGAAVQRVLLSIDDARTFVSMSTLPIRKLQRWLKEWFKDESVASLRIRSGTGGACLSHTHTQQIHYVLEALTLWGIVQRDIFDFWETAEQDMVTNCRGAYRYRDTGQGFHRVCAGPLTYQRMMRAISEAHQKMGGWVGSKVVHLGDNDVPNPLVFIDKYTIIPRLLSPIVQCIEGIDVMFQGEEPYPGVRSLVLGDYSGPRELQMAILGDFYRHGFDGSGDDGGSCIDGRLTSAWNWCSELHKKKFYRAFLLTGFTGFDANYN